MGDNVTILKNKLFESLGDKRDEYIRTIKKWFRLNGNKEQLKTELSQTLTPAQVRLHEQLLLRIFHKCADNPPEYRDGQPPRKRCYRNCDRMKDGFEPIDPTCYEVIARQEINAELPPFMIHERLLPDVSSTILRLQYSAWEIGVDKVCEAAAEFLVIATQHFLKNIFTAVISRKKGYKFNSKGFIHNLGCPTPNPWLQNVAKQKPDIFHPLEVEAVLKVVRPVERPTPEEREHDTIFRLAATTCDQEVGPISLYDLLLTLQLYPGLVSSNFVRVVNTERIYARICHPVIDD